MNASELMIMDWVLLDGTPIQVAGLHNRKVGVHKRRRSIYCSWHSDGEFRPIPLTEEILAKNGFEKNLNDEAPAEECYFYRLFAKPCGWFDIDAFGLEEELGAEFTYNDININYVHQLQHLLRLCGVEKELIID